MTAPSNTLSALAGQFVIHILDKEKFNNQQDAPWPTYCGLDGYDGWSSRTHARTAEIGNENKNDIIQIMDGTPGNPNNLPVSVCPTCYARHRAHHEQAFVASMKQMAEAIR